MGQISSFFGADKQFFGADKQFFAMGLLLAYKLCIFLLSHYFHPRDDGFVYNATMFTLHANEGSPCTEHVQAS